MIDGTVRPRLETEGASTLVLVSLVAMTGAWLIFLLPYGALSRAYGGTAGIRDVVEIAAAAGASLWVALVVRAMKWFEARRQARLLAYATPLPPGSAPVSEGLRRLFRETGIEVRLLGDPNRVSDRGGRITASPRVTTAFGMQNVAYIVLFPALAFARLRNDDAALDAVLAHESAHVLQHDLRILANLGAFLRTTLWFVPIAVVVSVANSVTIDIASGAGVGSAVLASILGKSSIAVLPLLILLSLAMLRFTESYRERLADAFAEDIVGTEALARADSVLSAEDHSARPWAGFGSIEVLYSWRLVAMYGFAIGALYGYGPSPLAYWQSVLPSGSPMRLFVSTAFATLATLIIYSAAFALAYVLTSNQSVRSMTEKSVGWRLVLFAALAVLGGLVTQTAPLMLSALPIFDRFPNIARHDALPLLLADLADSATSIVACTVAGILFATATNAGRTRRWFGWAAAGALTVLLGHVEPALVPQYTFGLASFVIGGVLIASAMSKVIPKAKEASVTTLGIIFAALLVIVGSWFGLGGPSCIAVSLENASASASQRGDTQRAIDLERRATKFASLNATGFLELARLQLASQSSPDDAIANAERALRAPFLHDWNERFDALVTAAAAHLERRERSDWNDAQRHLSSAREMWRRNSRLDPRTGVVLYYNSAVVACHEEPDSLSALSFLTAAIGFMSDDTQAGRIARTATGDPDLSCGSLTDATAPNTSTIEFFRSIPGDGTTESAVRQALARGLTRDEVMRLLRLLIRIRAEA